MISSNIPFILTIALILGVVFVNGLTDAPNAISTVVGTGALKLKDALILAGVCNFLGLLIMTSFNFSVAKTVTKFADFGDDTKVASIALFASSISIVVYGLITWKQSIPTSESHALLAGISGSAVAVNGKAAINIYLWVKILLWLIFSCLIGYVLGKIISILLKKVHNQKIFKKGQILSSAFMASMHGAQDGQKFIGLILLTVIYYKNVTYNNIPFWAVGVCSPFLVAGTCLCGGKIINTVGSDIVKLSDYQGFASDISSALSLLVCSLFGAPVSTTHTKVFSIVGAGESDSKTKIDTKILRKMVCAWIITFPFCFVLSLIITKIIVKYVVL